MNRHLASYKVCEREELAKPPLRVQSIADKGGILEVRCQAHDTTAWKSIDCLVEEAECGWRLLLVTAVMPGPCQTRFLGFERRHKGSKAGLKLSLERTDSGTPARPITITIVARNDEDHESRSQIRLLPT